MFLPFILTAIIYYLVNDLLHPKKLVFRADAKGVKQSYLSEVFCIFFCIFCIF